MAIAPLSSGTTLFYLSQGDGEASLNRLVGTRPSISHFQQHFIKLFCMTKFHPTGNGDAINHLETQLAKSCFNQCLSRSSTGRLNDQCSRNS